MEEYGERYVQHSQSNSNRDGNESTNCNSDKEQREMCYDQSEIMTLYYERILKPIKEQVMQAKQEYKNMMQYQVEQKVCLLRVKRITRLSRVSIPERFKAA